VRWTLLRCGHVHRFKEVSIKVGAPVSDPAFQICRRQGLNFIALIAVYS
jgi:hypothetical protein